MLEMRARVDDQEYAMADTLRVELAENDHDQVVPLNGAFRPACLRQGLRTDVEGCHFRLHGAAAFISSDPGASAHARWYA
jgi:hypothetical protein